MEDMARLALVEQNVGNTETFSKLLYELLRLINIILENPHEYELRTVTSELLKKYINNEAFGEYLKYVGFQAAENGMTYPKEQTLSKLRMAQAAVERKIGFCCGKVDVNQTTVTRPGRCLAQNKKPKLTPANILKTKNPLLLKIEAMFNNMLKYEDEDLQQAARALIPLATLQLAALDRVRDQQRRIKAGELKGPDLPFDIALLMELLAWFKHKFFRWVDKPPCELCSGPTMYVGSIERRMPTETCTVEMYKCIECPSGRAEFPRYNDPRTLLRTRRGRCGEWANAFTLLCRALGLDTRYVLDTTDHVWCEVYDYDSQAWLHVDPCEEKLDAPLLYCHGWGKALSYVIAASRDDLQDVTWRYTDHHRQVLKRRNLCSEDELIAGIMALRERRQRQVSEARRRYLARRTLQELVQLMVERKAGEHERHGRVSGSAGWVAARGEGGKGHEFRFSTPGSAVITYCCASDTYTVSHPDGHETMLKTWSAGAYSSKNVFRKVETDWNMVYLAREEGSPAGSVSWRLAAAEGLWFSSLEAQALHKTFGCGLVRWTIRIDEEKAEPIQQMEEGVVISRRFRRVELVGTLSGGAGAEAWQHAQLFRARAPPAARPALRLRAVLDKD